METPKVLLVNGRVTPWDQGCCHFWSETAQRGINVFDALRGYYDERMKVVRVIGLEDHLNRLLRSASLMRFPEVVDLVGLIAGIEHLMHALDVQEHVYIRPTIYVERGGYTAQKEDIGAGYYVVAVPIRSTCGNPRAVSATISSWQKLSSTTFPSTIKTGAAYGITRLARIDAMEKGAEEAILLNSRGELCETPGANLFVISHGKARTPAISDGVLDGITRKHLSFILKNHLGIPIHEETLPYVGCEGWQELFLCGTLQEIVAVREIDGTLIGSGKVGTITAELSKLYYEICTGIKASPLDWVTVFEKRSGQFIRN